MGESDSFERRVAAVVQEVLGLDAPPALDTSLRDDLGLSSMDGLTLVLTLEDEFGGTIAEEEMDAVSTVGDVVALVRARRST